VPPISGASIQAAASVLDHFRRPIDSELAMAKIERDQI
jgi:hypothetical protein